MKIPHWEFLLGPSLAFAVGFLSNAIVMAANHGQMPVIVTGSPLEIFDSSDLIHCAMTAQTHLKFLADWVVIPGMGIASPGDFGEWFWKSTWMPALCIWAALIIKDNKKNL